MPFQPARVVLSDAEQRIVRWIGRMRNRGNLSAGVVDQKRADDGERIDVIGFGAELAFCKLFNVYPDFDIGPRRGGVDAIRLGETVDVKATEYARGKLLAVPRKRELAADCYALIVVETDASYRFAGFARAADLLRPDRLTDLGRGAGFALDQDELSADQL